MIALLIVGLGGFVRSILSSIQASSTQHERALAREAARGVLETLLAADFSDVYALYNTEAADDPGGAGSAPGASFEVRGLDPLPGDADGFVGAILFPTNDVGGALQLREDLADVRFQTPRDLNGDGVVDDQDHSADHRLLPVFVRIDWRSNGRPARVEMSTLLADYQ